jgi:hypothetical protein
MVPNLHQTQISFFSVCVATSQNWYNSEIFASKNKNLFSKFHIFFLFAFCCESEKLFMSAEASDDTSLNVEPSLDAISIFETFYEQNWDTKFYDCGRDDEIVAISGDCDSNSEPLTANLIENAPRVRNWREFAEWLYTNKASDQWKTDSETGDGLKFKSVKDFFMHVIDPVKQVDPVLFMTRINLRENNPALRWIMKRYPNHIESTLF